MYFICYITPLICRSMNRNYVSTMITWDDTPSTMCILIHICFYFYIFKSFIVK